MASTWGLSWGASWGVSWDRIYVPPPPTAPVTTHAGGYRHRKGYIIRGKRYWLTEEELAVLVVQMLLERPQVKEITQGKPKPISRKVWDAIKPLARLEALAEKMAEPFDEDEELLILL